MFIVNWDALACISSDKEYTDCFFQFLGTHFLVKWKPLARAHFGGRGGALFLSKWEHADFMMVLESENGKELEWIKHEK